MSQSMDDEEFNENDTPNQTNNTQLKLQMNSTPIDGKILSNHLQT